MGVSSTLSKGPSLALGVDVVSPLELAGAYTPFANGGYRAPPYAIDAIETIHGGVVYRRDAHYDGVAASSRVIDGVNEMLRATVAWGTGRAAAINGRAVYGKTGTTQGGRDAWFVGHVDGLTAAVWVGRDDNAPVSGMTGGAGPAVIWREMMSRAVSTRPRHVQDPLAAILQGAPVQASTP